MKNKTLTEALKMQSQAVESLIVMVFNLGYTAGEKGEPREKYQKKVIEVWRQNNPYQPSVFDPGEAAKPLQPEINRRINEQTS